MITMYFPNHDSNTAIFADLRFRPSITFRPAIFHSVIYHELFMLRKCPDMPAKPGGSLVYMTGMLHHVARIMRNISGALRTMAFELVTLTGVYLTQERVQFNQDGVQSTIAGVQFHPVGVQFTLTGAMLTMRKVLFTQAGVQLTMAGAIHTLSGVSHLSADFRRACARWIRNLETLLSSHKIIFHDLNNYKTLNCGGIIHQCSPVKCKKL